VVTPVLSCVTVYCYYYVPPHLYTATSIADRPTVSDGLGEHKSHARMKRILEAGRAGNWTKTPLHSTIESIGHGSIAKTKAQLVKYYYR
jgi:hypothetical protein